MNAKQDNTVVPEFKETLIGLVETVVRIVPVTQPTPGNLQQFREVAREALQDVYRVGYRAGFDAGHKLGMDTGFEAGTRQASESYSQGPRGEQEDRTPTPENNESIVDRQPDGPMPMAEDNDSNASG